MVADPLVVADAAKLNLRLVHRAAAELRRGVPVILAGDEPLLIVAAETAGADALAELESLSGAHPTLILAPARAAAILRAPMSADVRGKASSFPASERRSRRYRGL